MIKFLVNRKSFEISREDINNFPIQDAYLNLLVKHFNENTIGVRCENGGIVISTEYTNFDKIVKIYQNPKIRLADLLSINFDHIENEKWKHGEIMKINRAVIEAEPLLCDTNFNRFIEELKFYGVYSLFEMVHEIDIETIIKRIYRKLFHKHFGDKREVLSFVHTLRTLNAYISGSFILETVLNEDWENTDIDVYINESILMNCYYDSMPFREIRSKDKDKNEKKINLMKLLYSKPNSFEEDRLNKFASHLVTYFGKDYSLVSIPTRRELDDGYGISGDLTCVIKMKYLDKVNIDLVIVNCTVPYFIERFDLKFNSIYFDTYTIHAFDWNAILFKKSINYYADDRYYNEIEKYSANIKRIKKYFTRGFVVTYKEKNWSDPINPFEIFDGNKDD